VLDFILLTLETTDSGVYQPELSGSVSGTAVVFSRITAVISVDFIRKVTEQ